MAVKSYGMTVDFELMEKFKEKCRNDNVKYSRRIAELIEIDLNGNTDNSLQINKTVERLESLTTTINQLTEKLKGSIVLPDIDKDSF